MHVFLSSKASRQLRKLPVPMHKLLIERIEQLGDDPLRAHAIKLASRNGWRIRVGDYRILYTIDRKKNEVTILSVAHRRDAPPVRSLRGGA